MKKLEKYTLETRGAKTLTINEGYEILEIRVQYGNPQLWVKVNTEKPEINVTLISLGENDEIPNKSKHIGSFSIHQGDDVYQVFQILD
jgi:hypothetical protein